MGFIGFFCLSATLTEKILSLTWAENSIMHALYSLINLKKNQIVFMEKKDLQK